MSLDRRLRDGLSRSPIDVDEGLDQVIDHVVARGRRRRRARQVVTGVLALAAVVGALVLGPRALDVIRDSGRTRPASPKELVREIAGTYMVTIEAGTGAIQAYDMAGTWVVNLLPTGAMEVTPPAAFLRSLDMPTGALFTMEANDFRTNALTDLCLSSVATYTWSLRDEELIFTPVTEDCAARRALLTSSAWVRQ